MAQTLKVAIVLGLITIGFASTASAVTMQATYTGTVIDGRDRTLLFGSGGILDGLSYIATFVYDTDIGRQSSPQFNQVYGGAAFGNPSPMLSSDITIGGMTFSFGGAHYGQATNSNDGAASYIYHAAQGASGTPFIYLYEYRDDLAIPLDITSAFAVVGEGLVAPGFAYQGFFDFGAGYGALSIDSVKVTQISAVPLPASLPLVVSGLACLGLIRRRKAKSTH
jgi:hypothetical protein